MDCRQARELLDLVLIDDPEVSDRQRAAFDAHVEACGACSEQLERSRRLVSLLREYGRYSPDTVELLESRGEVVPDHLRPKPEPEPEEEPISEEQIEAGVARLMAKLDEIDAGREGPEVEEAEPDPIEQIADLRRRVNTMEAYQARFCEAWRKRCAETDGDAFELADVDPRVQPAMPSTRRVARRLAAGEFAVAASLLLVVGAWVAIWQPSEPPTATARQQVAEQTRHTVQLITSGGPRHVELGATVASREGRLEVLLGGMHRAMLNAGTTASFEALPGADHAYVVGLAEGEAYVEVRPGHPFEVYTANARAQVTGTRFSVRAHQDATELVVAEGGVRFTARELPDQWVDLRADQLSTITDQRRRPTPPTTVNARARTAWASEPLPERSASALIPEIEPELESLPDEAWRRQSELDLDILDYEAWREENRGWFAEQFPWAMDLEAVLRDEHGLQADYLEVLVASGDIWQFRYPRALGEQIPVFDPAVVERLAIVYGIDRSALADAVSGYYTGAREEYAHGQDAFAEAIDRWRNSLRAAEPGAGDEAMIFTVDAARYLRDIRAAAYLWLRRHPERAQRLLLAADAEGHPPAWQLAELASARAQPEVLTDQVESAQRLLRASTRQLWLPQSDGCEGPGAAAIRDIEQVLSRLAGDEP